jgi:hypothetical protein
MNPVYAAAIIIMFIGALLIPFFTLTRRQRLRSKHPGGADDSGKKILYVFAILVALFGAFTLFRYLDVIIRNQDAVFYGAWLVLVMIAGMFVQELATAYRASKSFSVPKGQLVLPLLFSIVVFYPIWAIATSSARSFFVIHAAFLNGYFWESVVTSARPPEAGK